VVGVLKAKGPSSAGQDQDEMCSAASAESLPAARDHLTALLRQRHRRTPDQDDDFNLRTDDDAIRLSEEAARTTALMISSIALVSLVAGGVGVMNIMLVSVTERTREIGLRMATGARVGVVRLQFLVEALVIGLLGGSAGLLLGIGAADALTSRFGWPMLISTRSIAIAIGSASLTGVFFGYYPARRASGLDPIEALRAD
jgi:putative ABC transport system permease protein